MASLDDRIAAAATQQHGLIGRAQLLELGATLRQIEGRLGTGRWVRAQRGVYRIAGVPVTWQQRAMAAVLAGPAGAVASHLTAAALASLDVPVPVPPHLTVPSGRSARLADAVVHRSRLDADDTTRLQSIPATSVARTLVDCAGVLGPNRLQRLVDEALARRLVLPQQLTSSWARVRAAPGRPGEGRLRNALDPWQCPILPGSPPEARLLRLLVSWGYPAPQPQVRVCDADGTVLGRVDLGWPSFRLGLEYEGVEAHGPSRWAHDGARQDAIEQLGWRLLLVDKLDLQPGRRELRDALSRAWPAAA